MKLVLILLICVVVLGAGASFAQTRPGDEELIKRDKGVSDKKIARVNKEADALLSGILDTVKKRFPDLTLYSSRLGDPTTQGLGRRGQTDIEATWRNGNTQIRVLVTFFFNNREAVDRNSLGTNGIAMGDFFKAPEEFGTEAILVKNAYANLKMTNVGLHFVKGRLVVDLYYRNNPESIAKNEKELLKFARKILPLLNAKENFDDV